MAAKHGYLDLNPMQTDNVRTQAHLKTPLFYVAQIVPPLLMFLFVFGKWGPGAAFIVGPPILYSAVRIPLLLYRKQFRILLRPALTFLLALIIIVMGNYYTGVSARYIDQLAREMQAQCNHDGICKLPTGKWTHSAEYPTLFYTQTKGLVSMNIVLTFNESEPNNEPTCAKPAPRSKCPHGKSQTPLRFTTFHLSRLLDDFNYDAYGGIGRPLNILDTTARQP